MKKLRSLTAGLVLTCALSLSAHAQFAPGPGGAEGSNPGGGVGGDGSGFGAPGQPGSSQGISCNGAPLTSAQLQVIGSRGCFRKSYFNLEGGYSGYQETTGECFLFFSPYETNNANQLCDYTVGTHQVGICPSGQVLDDAYGYCGSYR